MHETGAPEEIRTPGPQIRSLVPALIEADDTGNVNADTTLLRPGSVITKPLILLVGAQGLEPWTR